MTYKNHTTQTLHRHQTHFHTEENRTQAICQVLHIMRSCQQRCHMLHKTVRASCRSMDIVSIIAQHRNVCSHARDASDLYSISQNTWHHMKPCVHRYSTVRSNARHRRAALPFSEFVYKCTFNRGPNSYAVLCCLVRYERQTCAAC